MSKKLSAALTHYRATLLATAFGDLAAKKAGLPYTDGRAATAEAMKARDDVLAAAKNLTNEQFVAALMSAQFLATQETR